MRHEVALLLLATHLLGLTQATSIPDNLQSFYASAQDAGTCTGSDLLKGGFYDTDDGSATFGYCQKGVRGTAIYLKGPGMKLVNMDVDCDGVQHNLDSRCEASTDTQAQTAFESQLQQYGISDLKADIHPYVVLGNEGKYSPTFDPTSVGVQPLSIVAVVCAGKLVYGIWGDVNGADGKPLVGEASLALATACYGQSITGDNGYDGEDVLYVAFVGDRAVPGATARWNASSYEEFEASISALGDQLVATLPNSVSNTSSVSIVSSSAPTTSSPSASASSMSGADKLPRASTVSLVCYFAAIGTSWLLA